MVTCVRMCNEFWRHNNSETGQTEQSDSLEMNRMCKKGTLRREMRKIQRAIFFLTPGILMRFLAKKCENIAKYRQKMIPGTDTVVVSRVHCIIHVKCAKQALITKANREGLEQSDACRISYFSRLVILVQGTI